MQTAVKSVNKKARLEITILSVVGSKWHLPSYATIESPLQRTRPTVVPFPQLFMMINETVKNVLPFRQGAYENVVL